MLELILEFTTCFVAAYCTLKVCDLIVNAYISLTYNKDNDNLSDDKEWP